MEVPQFAVLWTRRTTPPFVQVVVRIEGASDSAHRQSWVMTAVMGLSAVFPHFSRSSGLSWS